MGKWEWMRFDGNEGRGTWSILSCGMRYFRFAEYLFERLVSKNAKNAV